MLLALTALSCSSRESVALVGQPVRKPVAVLVHVSDEAAATDDGGGTATLVEAVTHVRRRIGQQGRVCR
jgi:hypothetical protein